MSLIENIQRKTLDPIEEARAFKAYVDDFGWGGITELASRITKSSSYVCKRLSLLKLPTELLEKVSQSEINPSTAEELISIKDQKKRQYIADIVVKNSYSSKETRMLRKINQDRSRSPMPTSNAMYINSFDKSIIALKVAMIRIVPILETVADNWIIYELLMQHKNILNTQIDIMIKEKKKLQKLRLRSAESSIDIIA